MNDEINVRRSPSPHREEHQEPSSGWCLHYNHSIYTDLVQTTAFERLKNISFLGAIDYYTNEPSSDQKKHSIYTRHSHSIGVMKIADLYCEIRDIEPEERILACTSALLHDIGHPPFSHSAEPVFSELFDVDHHKATKDIITGKVPIGEDVPSILKEYNICPDEVVSIISGEDNRYDGFFSGPINFDTIEGVLSAYKHVCKDSNTPNPTEVVKAASHRESTEDQNIVDEFWEIKDNFYAYINSRANTLLDTICQRALREYFASNQQWYEIYYLSTEDQISNLTEFYRLKQIKSNRHILNEILQSDEWSTTNRYRHYFINEQGDFFSREDKLRYQHEKYEDIGIQQTVNETGEHPQHVNK